MKLKTVKFSDKCKKVSQRFQNSKQDKLTMQSRGEREEKKGWIELVLRTKPKQRNIIKQKIYLLR